MDLNEEILELTSALYNNVRFTNSDVQFIINLISNFILNSYNPLLLNELSQGVFKVLNNDVVNDIKFTFNKHKDIFQKYNSDKKRLCLYKNLGLFVEPKIIIIDNSTVSKMHESTMSLKSKPITMVHLSVKNSLQRLLQMDGLLEATFLYMNSLEKENYIVSSFIQGNLWKRKLEHFKETGIPLPLVIYFDDVETGNALGSHAGKNQIGGVYATIPCFPPNFASKLQSIFVTDIFYSQDRKKYGNQIIFQSLINELNDLRKNGMIITVKNKVYKLYIITSLILGDNLGLNSILGFVESFGLTRFCRFCNMDPNKMKTSSEVDASAVRTVQQYQEDISTISTSKSGLKEACIFNDLADFHVIENGNVDVMHDVFEGVANYVMAQILLKLILEDKCFSIDLVNNILNSTDFAFESTNLPRNINIEYVKTNNKLKMSASEMLFFTRYFGLMIGHLVPEDNKYWLLYVKLREIIHIITAPEMSYVDCLQLEILIKEHHDMYLKLFGNLKAKFHMMLHYKNLMLQNGPLIKVSSMRFESKHRELKAIIQATASRRNVLKTIGTRLQLKVMNIKYSQYQDLYVTYGHEVQDYTMHTYFPHAITKKSLSNVIINDYTYKCGTIIVGTMNETCVGFGEIDKIYIIDDEIIFRYIPFKTVGFSEHYFGYSITADVENRRLVNYNAMVSRTPCLIFKINGVKYVATRNRL